jgi:hypothetical protein
MTANLRNAYDYLFDQGELDDSFDVTENIPSGKNRKKAVDYHYAGKRAYPFAFIVNSGERKNYHLFYIRRPREGDLEEVQRVFSEDLIFVNKQGEITVHIHDLVAATNIWDIVSKIKLQ